MKLRLSTFAAALVPWLSQGAPPVSSPEGTATSYVSEHGPLVYAPRAARAQKVIFDTPVKQLIYAPDTPFRRFFDSRAADFQDDKLEYAKTTILGDIVAMLKSKEYIHEMVVAIVEQHKSTAISGECPGMAALSAASAILPKVEDLLESEESLATDAFLASEADLRKDDFVGAAAAVAQLEAITRGNAQSAYISELHTNAVALQKDLSNWNPPDVAAWLARCTKATEKLRNTVEDPSTRAKILQECAETKKWRDNHAKLLADTCYLALLNENYPDMDDGEIDKLFTETLPRESDVWQMTTSGGITSPAVHAFGIELRQRLKQRLWLRTVVDHAIAKRADLFRRSGSPVTQINEVEESFRKLIETRLFSEALLQSVRSGSGTLWSSFAAHANSTAPGATNRFLLQPSNMRERNMDSDELRIFANAFRQELSTAAKAIDGGVDGTKLKKAIVDFFAKPENAARLCPEFGSGSTAAQLQESERAFWKQRLSQSVDVVTAYKGLTNDTDWRGASYAAAKTNFVTVLAIAIPIVNQARHISERSDSALSATLLTNRVDQFITKFRSEHALTDKPPSLDDVLAAGAGADLPLSTYRPLQRLVADFDMVFGANPEWINSDEPLLKTFIASHLAKYATPAAAKKAAESIPLQIYSRAMPASTSRSNLVEVFAQVVRSPEFSFYFGPGNANPQVVEAFTQEFCSAFQNPANLRAAIEAEREADYEYWWLTFYPKAIPLGSKRLQGASIIEIGFPDSAIPEAQYHRWLQDTRLEEGSLRTGAPNEAIRNVRLRNVTTLLRDMLNVLEAVDLKEQFSEVRPVMVHGLDAFTEDSALCDEQTRLIKGLQRIYNEVFESIAADAAGEKSPRNKKKKKPIKAANAYEHGVEREVFEFATNIISSLVAKERQQTASDLHARTQLRRKLNDLDLQPIHVLFSACAVADSKARLPEKVNLLLWAQARGVMLNLHERGDFAKKPELAQHAVDYYNHSEPLRGDHISTLDDIDPMHWNSLSDEAKLYDLILNSYFSGYPDVPTKSSIQEAYFNMDGRQRLISLTYDWLDMSAALYNTNNALQRRFVSSSTFLTSKGQRLLQRLLSKSAKPKYRDRLHEIVDVLFNHPEFQPLVDELDGKLLDFYYASLWQMLAMLEETERHAVPYQQITPADYKAFRSWGRPRFQKGIQIVEMLPASRDDLVSMSVNEGGVVARLAGQAEGSAAYDLNQLRMAQQYGSIASTSLGKALNAKDAKSTNGLNTLKESLDETTSSRRREVVRDVANLNQSASSQGYSLGATASGSVYARARAAMAYSRRREYLDAAITAAGRGDNYAKWVVRTSDLRSDLARGAGKKLVAAAHSGFPNGDQPFHLLVKVPRRATQVDWSGREYIHFSSTYAATSRQSAWQEAGFLGLIGKAPLAILNPNWWTKIEEGLVGTQYPFMWDVRNTEQQLVLLRTPNTLAGSVWLDDTDKVKYSEIQELLTAEDNFIRLTREAQTKDLGTTMADIQKESAQFSADTRKQMADQQKTLNDRFTQLSESQAISNRLSKMESELRDLRSRLNTSTNASSTNGSGTAQ